MDDQFRQHGIIVRRHSIPAVNSGVDAYAFSARKVHVCDRSRRGAEVLRRVFRIDPALDGVSRDMDIFLFIAQRLSVCDADLLLHQIDARHPLCDRMLYLDPGVHLHEIEIPVLFQQEFDGTCIGIMGCFCRLHGCLSHLLSQLRRKCDGRGLFNHFLMIPLDRAVALS